MRGYAAQARIGRARVHGRAVDAASRRREPVAAPVDLVVAGRVAGGDAPPDSRFVELDGTGTSPVGGRLGDLRRAWAEATFYLFDPDGWR